MKVYELETVGIPECCMTFGLFLNKENAKIALEEKKVELMKEDGSYGMDYVLTITEREVN